jgi:hypothetical protein
MDPEVVCPNTAPAVRQVGNTIGIQRFPGFISILS